MAGAEDCLLGTNNGSTVLRRPRWNHPMRAALLLSAMFIIGGILAALGYPAVYVAHRPAMGLGGLLIALFGACLPPLVVFGIRRLRQK